MIERYRERYGYLPQTLAADTTYGKRRTTAMA
jgi:hypothetical protein